VPATKEKIRQHKRTKQVLAQRLAKTKEDKPKGENERLAQQKHIIQEYNRLRTRKVKREQILHSWTHGTTDMTKAFNDGSILEKEEMQLATREPQVILKQQHELKINPHMPSIYMPTRPNMLGGDNISFQLPQPLNTNVATPRTRVSTWEAGLATRDEPERTQYERQAKQAAGYKPRLFPTRCIQEAFGALTVAQN